MKDFPTKLTPNNLEKFKHYRTQRNICKLKQFIYEFMLSDDFINNKNRGIEITQLGYSMEEIQSVIESLKLLGGKLNLNSIILIYLFIRQIKFQNFY